MFRAFCADPKMPSREKLVWRWLFRADGDFRAGLAEPLPFVVMRAEVGISIENLSLLGTGNGLTELAAVIVVVAEWGESPVDRGDMLFLDSEGARRPVSSGLLTAFQRLSRAWSTVLYTGKASKSECEVRSG